MTFSVVARCKRTGQVGVGVATARHLDVRLAAYTRSRVGAVVTQGAVNPYFGYDGLRDLSRGRPADEAMRKLLSKDSDPDARQLAVVDGRGGVAAWTGERVPGWAADLQGASFSTQGSRVRGSGVLEAMGEVMRSTEGEYMVERLLQALEAGGAEGGDVSGERAAHLRVMEREEYALWDLRVDDADEPLRELRRLYDLFEGSVLPQVREMPKRAEFFPAL